MGLERADRHGRSIEAERIRREYARRAATIPAACYALDTPANLFAHQQRARRALALLETGGLLPLCGRRVLEVGCGTGGWLPQFEGWGVRRGDLAGIDLDPQRAAAAAIRCGAARDESGTLLAAGADIRCGDAANLPWRGPQFDIAVVSTVFTSILDPEMKQAIAGRLLDVLKPDGAVLWYDFFVDNPWNPNVRGVPRREIETLFRGCDIRLSRVTLAPPLAQRLVPVSWGLAVALEATCLLNTHYLGLFRKR